MKKFLIFILLLAAVVGIYLFNAKKNADKIVESAKEESKIAEEESKIRDAHNVITIFNIIWMKNEDQTISINELINRYNKEQEERVHYNIATLNSNNTITIKNDFFKYSYDCSIKTENCKFKIVCYDKETDEMDLGEC